MKIAGALTYRLNEYQQIAQLLLLLFLQGRKQKKKFQKSIIFVSFRKMIVHRLLDSDSSHNDNQHSQHTNKMTNNRQNQNYQLYCNRDRNKLHLLLLLIAIIMCKCCAVTGDSTGKCLVIINLCIFQKEIRLLPKKLNL